MESVRRVVGADRAVTEVVRALTLQLGPEEVLLNLEVRFAAEVEGAGIAEGIRRLEGALRRVCPSLREIFIEPCA